MRITAVCVALAIIGCGEDTTTGPTVEVDATVETSVFPDVVEIDTALPETEIDTASPETVDIDTDPGTPDAEVSAEVAQPGEFGSACAQNSECFSGYCVEGPDGYVCTRLCSETCPADYDCRGVAGESDVTFLCMPRTDKNCTPCRDDLQCNGGECLEIEGELRCAESCLDNDDCPGEFECVGDKCMPMTGSCTCYGGFNGGLRTCTVGNAVGTCYGVETCDPTNGWGTCDAQTPVVETCNGRDDDCDAFLDEDLDAVGDACEVTVGGVGSCDGTLICAGIGGLQCQGPTPTPETCDFEDDNCDGQVDEDFKTGAVYSKFEHCGTCNRSCAIGFPNAAQTTCQVQQGVAQCVVVSCEPGYIKQNDFQCIPDIVNLCEPCSEDANCLGQGSACVTLSDGSFCAKACSDGDPTACPTGFSCQTVAGETSKQCLPTTGVCSCGPATLGLSRACSVTVSPNGQPSTTCAGTETCGGAGWGSCVLPVEACNSFDDDCDGTVDDGFKNASGEYDRVDNCGACGISCLALSFPNAAPICDASGSGAPQCSYRCNADWVDIDGLPGCECRPTSTVDLPDPDGIDANCDGIDGEVGKSIFVAKTGDDAGLGTIDDPLRTVQAGITRAISQNKRDVLVATGVYVESVGLANRVNVYGGYAPDFAERDRFTHESAILGVDPTDAARGAVYAAGIALNSNDAVKFDGFSVFGADNFAAGGNSYAIYLRDVGPFVTISNNAIVAGNGGAGVAGSKGTDGTAGTNGAPGVGARMTTTDNACSTEDEGIGGIGGAKLCGPIDVSGGGGGTSVCPAAPVPVNSSPQTSLSREYGAAGVNGGGAGGEPGWDQRVSASCTSVGASNTHDSFGADGASGSNGTDGVAGGACVAGPGTVFDGHWVGPAAGAAVDGGHGRGGGGGGAGGGVDVHTCADKKPVVSGSGGGGGSGGCGGTAGAAGGTGGGSFAIFLAYASAPVALPTISNNVVFRGRGGPGGAGGAGGVGGFGGVGGLRGPSNRGTDSSGASIPLNCCASAGGNGAAGGIGGQGPGGSGGCGGASLAIYISSNALATPRTNMIANSFPDSGASGSGGPGGTSLGNVGLHGGSGMEAATNY